MKKYLLIIVATISIVPSITFASWWNPTSWSFFHFLFQPNPQVQIINATTSSNQIFTDIATTTATTTISKTETTVVATSTPPINKPVKKIVEKVTPIVKTPKPPVVEVQVQQPTQINGTLCNGTYWNECPTGQNLICPQTGGAYCEIQKTDQQRCESSYGLDSVYSGNKNANSGPICGCKNGYEWNSNQTSCQLRQQSIQQPAPPQPIQAQTQPTTPQNQNTPVIIRTIIVNQPIPTVPILPTVEQQTQACQKQHDTDVSSLTDRTQQTKNSLERAIAIAQQRSNALAENGLAFSGQRVQLGQEITDTQTRIDNLLIDYQASLEGLENSLKTCLDNVVKLP